MAIMMEGDQQLRETRGDTEKMRRVIPQPPNMSSTKMMFGKEVMDSKSMRTAFDTISETSLAQDSYVRVVIWVEMTDCREGVDRVGVSYLDRGKYGKGEDQIIEER